MTKEEYQILKNYPLEIKVAKTKARIHEFVRRFGIDGVQVSFSGGKDSTVLLDIARQEYHDIKATFCDTGLEYPEIKEFVKTYDNVDFIRPKKTFKEVITKYGYPVVSKEQSNYIYEIRQCKAEKTRNKRLYGDKNGNYKLSKKWHFLLDAPFLISGRCCYHLKKAPIKSYQNKTRRYPIIGTLAEESALRLTNYYRHGCNNFDGKNPKSTPLSFWTNQDILEYIVQNDLPVASCYGNIKRNDLGDLYTDGVDRTGCIFCAYGVHREFYPNKYQRLKQTHPKLYNYCIKGGEYNEDGLWVPNSKGLGFGKVLDFTGIYY